MARILIIDDDDCVRAMLAQVLPIFGHEVNTASDGQEGLALLEIIPVDLIIADLFMPNMDGIETLIAVRRRYGLLKFIGMSGAVHAATDSGLETMRLLGANHVLAKPFTPRQLLSVMDELLGTDATAAQPEKNSEHEPALTPA